MRALVALAAVVGLVHPAAAQLTASELRDRACQMDSAEAAKAIRYRDAGHPMQSVLSHMVGMARVIDATDPGTSRAWDGMVRSAYHPDLRAETPDSFAKLVEFKCRGGSRDYRP